MVLVLFKPSRVTQSHGPAFRVGWLIWRAIVWFLALSVGLTLVYRFVPVPVPVPVTITMLADALGFTRDWTSLSEIDRDMVLAAG